MIRLFVLFFFATASVLHADDVLERILAMKYVEPTAKRVIGFTDYGGDWTVDVDGVVSVSAGPGPKLVCDMPLLANLTEGEVSVELFFPEKVTHGSNGGILTKVQQPGIGADNFIGYEIAINPDEGYLHIGRHRFNYEPITRVSHRFHGDRWITLRVVFAARSMEVFIDEQFVRRYEAGDAPLIPAALLCVPGSGMSGTEIYVLNQNRMPNGFHCRLSLPLLWRGISPPRWQSVLCRRSSAWYGRNSRHRPQSDRTFGPRSPLSRDVPFD